jgi:hypothetical protein
MNRYIVLTEDGCCGHKHLHYGRALDCLDKFEDHGRPAMIAPIPKQNRMVDPLWIDHCLLKHTSMREMAEALQA